MTKDMIIASSAHETKVALREEGQVTEIYVEREKEVGLVGSIYKGRVTRVLPGMQSAFVDIGLERDAFLYVSDFFEGLEEYEHVAPTESSEPAVEPETDEDETAASETAAEEEAQPDEDRQPVEDTQPVAEAQPDEDRQPDFISNEPELRLPEQRPQGRPRRRHRSRRRGGRRRHGRDRRPGGPMGEREERPAAALPPADDIIILPGESLAKYRDHAVPSPASPEPTAESLPGESLAAVPLTPAAEEPTNSPAPVEVEPQPEEIVAPAPPEPEPQVEEIAAPALPEPEPQASEPTPATQEETAAPEAPSPGEETAPSEPEEARFDESQPAVEPPAESYPDATALAEIQRVRRYQEEETLPPSVQERTAGGVEWDRQRGQDRGRGRGQGRGRGRGRARGRGGRGGRGRDRQGRGREQRGRGRRGGGSRMRHARPSRGQPAIAKLLRAGQEIIVQIAKEQMGKKGARITSHITLPGRYLVFMPTIDHIGISRKIATSEERSRLRRLLLDLKGNVSGGFVVRTAATGCSEDDLREDIDYLVKLWHDIRVQADESRAPLLLHTDLTLTERLLRDHLTPDFESVWVDNEEEYTKVVEFISRFQSELTNRAKLFTRSGPIFEEMGVQQEIDRALRPKVWLKSGGYIVINHTEALVAIDVNTGKFVGKGSTRLEDTIVKTNLEAVREIVRQIRLRDLGGIIVIDFIDMEDSRNRHRVMRALEEELRIDRSPSKLLSFNEFGLVAITRKRSRQSLERVLCQPCPYCTGTGMVKSLETLCLEIQAEAKKFAGTIDAPELTIRANPEVVKSLKSRDHALVTELEEETGKSVILQSDTTLHFEQYNIY